MTRCGEKSGPKYQGSTALGTGGANFYWRGKYRKREKIIKRADPKKIS